MSEEAQQAPQPAEGTRSPVESKVSTEVAPESQETTVDETPDVNQLVAESRKYRKRSQAAETELAKLQKQISSDREKQMEEQQQWQTLAEERQARISELEPIVERAMNEETALREQILAEFSEEDRETFGDLPLPKLRALQSKFNQNTPRVPIASNPGVPANEVPEDWTKMNRNDRAKHWDKIISSYRK
jgi:chromosome segregation ATPase